MTKKKVGSTRDRKKKGRASPPPPKKIIRPEKPRHPFTIASNNRSAAPAQNHTPTNPHQKKT
jgi:hypothetical protein